MAAIFTLFQSSTECLTYRGDHLRLLERSGESKANQAKVPYLLALPASIAIEIRASCCQPMATLMSAGSRGNGAPWRVVRAAISAWGEESFAAMRKE
jgi:hypothetical protein